MHLWPTPSAQQFSRHVTAGLLVAAAVVLAIKPLVWLFGTWYLPGYEGTGVVAALLVLALALVSGLSGRQVFAPLPPRGLAVLLLGVTSLIRLTAQWLDINVLGALLLVVDVYAIAHLAQLRYRKVSLSPFWLACLFAFALPIEPMVQRLVGFGLQHLSASVACTILAPWFSDLQCDGVRLVVSGKDILVDLPCSGAQLLSASAMMMALIHTLARPSWCTAVLNVMFWFVLSLLGNGLRIALLAVGIAYARELPFSVMDPWPHTIIGFLILAAVSGGLAVFALRNTRRRSYAASTSVHQFLVHKSQPKGFIGLTLALGLFCFAALVGSIRPQPLDASPPLQTPVLPVVAADFFAEPQALSDQEESYFAQYGGGASKASFGPYGLLLVRTSSPLRHLHDPTVCWKGLGYQVSLHSTDHVENAVIYQASRDEERYWLKIRYRADDGRSANSVSEAVWHWMRQPDIPWTMVQQVIPVEMLGTPQTQAWDQAVASWSEAMSTGYSPSSRRTL